MTDILVIVLFGFVVGLSAYGIWLLNRLAAMRRQLEEEWAYNEQANERIMALLDAGHKLTSQLAEANRLAERHRLLYVQHTRQAMAQNFVIISRNVERKTT